MTHDVVPLDEARAPAQRISITAAMARHYEMEPDTFMATMRATVFAKGMTREEEAAFLLVARHHNLNPVTREIYAMPKKGGGIIPVVGIDGWVRMTNEHSAFDGMEFEFEHDGDKLVSTTCRIYRKDRSHPIVVTEYLAECRRETDAWKMQHRMMRHRAMIQCARYAFGFAGIYDPDEAETFAAPSSPARVAPSAAAPMIEHQDRQPAASEPVAAAQPDPKPTEKPQERRRAPSAALPPQAKPQPASTGLSYDPEKVRAGWEKAAKLAKTRDELNEAFEQKVGPYYDEMMPPDKEDADRIYNLRAAEIDGTEGAEP